MNRTDDIIFDYEDNIYKVSSTDNVIKVENKLDGSSFSFVMADVEGSMPKDLFKFIRHLLAKNKYGLLLSESDIAKDFNMCISTVRSIRNWKGLTPIKMGNYKNSAIRYSIDALMEFFDKCKDEMQINENAKISRLIARKISILKQDDDRI